MMNESPGSIPPAVLPFWYAKVLTALAVLSAIGTSFSGIAVIIDFRVKCIVGGILQIIVGLFLVAVELSFIFGRFPQLEKPIAMANALGDLQRGIAYLMIGILFLALCAGLSNFIPLTGLLIVGLMYGYRWYKLRGVVTQSSYEANETGDRIVLQDDYKDQVTNSAFQAAATPQGQAVIMNVGAHAAQQQWGTPGGVH